MVIYTLTEVNLRDNSNRTVIRAFKNRTSAEKYIEKRKQFKKSMGMYLNISYDYEIDELILEE